MPQLPTIEVTEAQQARILEAYKAKFGTETTAETVTEFKKLIADLVRREVVAYEYRKLEDELQTKAQASKTEVHQSLPEG